MFKKGLYILVLVLALTGCSTVDQKENLEDSQKDTQDITDSIKEDTKKEEKIEPETSDTEEENSENDTSNVIEESENLSSEEYAIKIFSENGKNVDSSTWIFENQGPNKVAVIIKEPQTRNRPIISKLIFLWYGNSDTAEILFLQVDNNIIISND